MSHSPVSWSVFMLGANSSSNTLNSGIPDEQRLSLWQPEKIGKYQIVVRPFTLYPGHYRFEATVRIQHTTDCDNTIDSEAGL